MRRSRGQGSAEMMLVISVVSIAAVASASTMIPLFRSGVENLGRDVSVILSSGSVGGANRGNGGAVNGSVNSRSAPGDREAAAADVNGSGMGDRPGDIGPPVPL
jgi:hypothetical protein